MAVLHHDVRPETRVAARAERGTSALAVELPVSVTDWRDAAAKAVHLGFDTMLAIAGTPGDPAADGAENLAELVSQAHAAGLRACITISLDRVSSTHALAADVAPGGFNAPRPRFQNAIDPRQAIPRGDAIVGLRRPSDGALLQWWQDRISHFRDIGFDGAAVLDAGLAATQLAALLAQKSWPIQHYTVKPSGSAELHRLVGIAEQDAAGPTSAVLAHVAFEGRGWAILRPEAEAASIAVRAVNRLLHMANRSPANSLRHWTGPAAALDIASRKLSAPVAGPLFEAEAALVLVRNRGSVPASWPPAHMPPMPWQDFVPVTGLAQSRPYLNPGETILLEAYACPAAVAPAEAPASSAAEPSRRIAITRVSPSADGGAFAIKTVIGATLHIEADIFADGHEKIAAAVLLRADGEEIWTRHAMMAQPNDAWAANVRTRRLGKYDMAVQAWLDVWGGFVRDLQRKCEAGQDVALELQEARALIEAALPRATKQGSADLIAVLQHLGANPVADPANLLAAAPVTVAMAEADNLPFLATSFVQPIVVEREAAQFSSWYELFPRSQGADAMHHGTFADAAERLAHIAAMGFDTVYFPPIHPIGERNRKGQNNAVSAQPGDVGSPYAIGSRDGGHDAIHKQLGTLDDFQALLATARQHGLEVALDFAIQCAPDHPWLSDHPGWFAWRPDGSIKYAENPPKKYQDIVNVDFYAQEAVPALWNALRDVVLFWAGQGIRSFRVDNPHTKPLPFWAWLIAEVKQRFPDAIFLSEAFTRPKPMYQLAKAGFSQSYTYFTWRNDKAALTEYLTELTQTDVRDYFRPHFFVNTPDINPLFLQTSGRPGFLIRAALASTLSGLWGVYAGFELCESAFLPGREEYLDSEKYQLRPRPARAEGDIVDAITQLNRLRRAEPALQSHLGIEFHNAYNDQILYFSKAAPGQTSRILVAVSTDPNDAQEADVEIPLWLFGLADWQTINVEDLLAERQFSWTGKMQRLRLTPQAPYGIWRLTAPGGI